MTKKEAEAQASVITRKRRSGLKVYVETAGSAVARFDAALDFPARLKLLRERASAYAGVKDVADELEWIEDALAAQDMGRWIAIGFAMLALERGLDLLDTGAYLKDLTNHQNRLGPARAGTIEANKARAVLPPAAEIAAAIAANLAKGISEWATKEQIRKKYKVTRKAVDLRLKKKPEAP